MNWYIPWALKLSLIAVELNKSNPENRNLSAITAGVAWPENKTNSAAPGHTWDTLCFQRGRQEGEVGIFDHVLVAWETSGSRSQRLHRLSI